MSTPLAAGVLLALASAFALDVGFLLQHSGAAQAPALSIRRPLACARALLGARAWLAGFAIGLAGWALYVGALGLAPISLVQAAAAGGVGLLVGLVAIQRRARPQRGRVVGAVVATAGLAALAVTLPGTPVRAVALDEGRLAVCGACVLAARGGAANGAAAGLCYGLADVLTKALLIAVPADPSARDLFLSPLVYATAAASGAAFVLLQRAFQRGGPLSVVSPMTAATNLLPIAAGVLVLGDPLPSSHSILALRLLAFGATAAGALAVARERGPAG
jgi:hypothetical protein